MVLEPRRHDRVGDRERGHAGPRRALHRAVSAIAGQTLGVPLALTNVGLRTWQPGVDNVAYHIYRDGALVTWDGARTPLPAAVPPGASVNVAASIAVPTAGGTYDVRIDLVQEGVAWYSSQGVIPAGIALTAQ